MQEMHLEQVAAFIQHVTIKLNQATIIRGRFGIGKSAITNTVQRLLDNEDAIAALLGEGNKYQTFAVNDNNEVETRTVRLTGCVICDVRLSQYESVDLRGFPGVDRQTGFTVWHAPSTLPFVGNNDWPDDKIIILFLDEITSATPPVFSVAYQLINERRIGEHVLKPNVRILCAGNREDDQGIVNRMPMPLCNRLTWVEAISDHKVWGEWGVTVGIDPVIIAFLHFKPTLLMTYVPGKAEKVVATPRTWEKAAAYYADNMPDDIKWAAISGAVGAGPAAELRAFINVWQRVTPIKDIIKDPEGVKVPVEADMRYATAVNVSGALSGKTIGPLYTFLKRLPAEMTVLAWQLGGKRDPSIYRTPEFMDFTKRYRSVFNI
jgi:hypothetical protein